jgi:hypothetical protein
MSFSRDNTGAIKINGGSGETIESKMDVQQIDSLVNVIAISSVAFAARFFSSYRTHMSWKLALRKFAVAVAVGLLCNELFTALAIEERWRGSVVALIAIFADDIMAVLMDLGNNFRKNPLAIVRFFQKYIKKT